MVPISVTASNLVLGPARLYTALYSTAEPPDADISPAGENFIPPAPWTDVGGTDGGVTFEADVTLTDLEVDQVTMPVGSRQTAMKMTVAAKLSEMTLANLNLALNNIATITSGSGFSSLDIPVTSAATQPNYAALFIVGWAPYTSTPMARWVIVRKMLCQTKAQLVYDKKTQQAFDCTWTAYYVSDTIPPVHINDQDQ